MAKQALICANCGKHVADHPKGGTAFVSWYPVCQDCYSRLRKNDRILFKIKGLIDKFVICPIAIKGAKCNLYHKLLAKNDISLTDIEVELMYFLMKDKDVQDVLKNVRQ